MFLGSSFQYRTNVGAWQRRGEPGALGKSMAQGLDADSSREHFDDRDVCCPSLGSASDMRRGGKPVTLPYRRSQSRGLNIGDVIYDELRVYGDDVNIAARLQALAEPGTIYVSSKVYEDIQGKVRFTCDDLGEKGLKNITRPVHVFRLRPSGTVANLSLPSAAALGDRPSIAVLPFADMTGDHQQEYLADGIVEDLITALSKFRWLLVIAWTSSFTYKGRAVDVRRVARELSVRYVVEGSIRKSGNRLRIAAQLIDAGSGAHIWAERYDRNLRDIFEIQDEITHSIATALAPELTGGDKSRPAPTSTRPQCVGCVFASVAADARTHPSRERRRRRTVKKGNTAVSRLPGGVGAPFSMPDAGGLLRMGRAS
jgi:TolB-like protein